MRRFVPPVPRRASYFRLFAGILVAVGLALTTISAQIPGRNINMVAGNVWPQGDPYLQRQNEPTIGASTRNPLHLLAGANDYRTVDLPGLAEDETGDAWLGLYKSFDGGQRWESTLLPGYLQDHSALGLASPIHGYGAAADPVVRAGTNGLMYYAGLVFDRSNPATPDVPGKSAIFVSRFIDNNNKEAGDPFEYLGTRALQTDPGGATGNFLDKPWLAVDIPRDNLRCTIVTPGEKGPITQSIPSGPLYVAYTVRSTDKKGERYDVMFTRSADCGNTWSVPTRVNDANERANQSASIAIDPRNGNVFIAWRQFDLSDDDSGVDALEIAKFNLPTKKFDAPNHGRKFDKPKKRKKAKKIDLKKFYKKGGINKALEADELAPLDQSTSAQQIRFRTNAYPSMVIDETGRIYMVWAERGYDPLNPDPVLGSARVLIATSPDGKNWTNAVPVASEHQQGHQLMPSITYAGGKLMLIYYDVRETRSHSFTQYVEDKTAFNDPTGTGLRNTIDLRSSMASKGASPVFSPSVAVSEYLQGPRTPGGPDVPWQVNPPNLPMFQKGTAPFIGDYVDITAAPQFVLDATGKWTYNTAAGSAPPIFHATWTDNRDVRVPLVDANGDGNPWNDYTPVGVLGGTPSIFDPTKIVPQCIAGNAGSRNQNVYTARITGGLLVGSPGNTKRLGYRLDPGGNPQPELIDRSFVVFAQNTTDGTKRFRFTITNQPAGGRASFDQFAAPPLTVIEADIPYRSTASRTVYARSTNPHALINVTVAELVLVGNTWQVKSGGLASNIVLNPDIDNPDIDNPDIDNPDIDNPDIDNAEVYNPDIDNPDIDNPDIDNPDIDNPDIDNPDIDNVRVANPDIDNPDIDNPDIDNPDIDNPDIDNPDIDNPDIDNASLMTDVTWAITNTGNTTASYNVNLFFAQQTFDPQIKTQLILYRTYKTPVVRNCELKSETHNVLVANVPNPQLVTGSTGNVSNPNDSSVKNATIYLSPGESAKITLRVFDPAPDPAKVVTVTNQDGTTAKISAAFVPNEDVTPVVQQQSVNTEDVDQGVTEPPIVVQFPPPQTVPDSASTSENTPVTVNPLANDSTAFGSTKVLSYHPAGMAAHSGAPVGDVAYQSSTGFVYTQRGAVDPLTNTLVARFPLPPGGNAVISQTANQRTGINYGRTNNTLSYLTALDARPDSATFHTYLTMPVLSDAVLSFALDTTHGRLYAVQGPQQATPTSPTTVSTIDITPGSPTFHQVIASISLPVGIRSQVIAVNSRTRKVYVTANGVTGGGQGGVFVIDTTVAVPTALRIPNATNGAFSLIVNESANMVFASTNFGQAAVYAIDGSSNAVVAINTGMPFRFGSNDERFAIHEATGKLLYRLENTVVIIDGQRGSPTRNTVLATLSVGRENSQPDIAIDQERGIAVTVGSYDFQADVIDVNSNALITSFPLSTFATDITVDPIHHRFFASVFTYVQEIELDPTVSLGSAIPVFIESGSILINPLKNKGYAGLFSTQTDIKVISGAGSAGSLPGILHQGRYLFSDWHTHTNRGFIVNQGDSDGEHSEPGTVLVIDGATETVLGYVDVLPSPFGIGIDQVHDKIYVASLSGPTAHGGLTIIDANDPELDTTQATFTAAFPGAYPGFPLTNTGALLAFGRHVVANPVTGKVYTLQSGGSLTSAAMFTPLTNALTPLDGIAGSPLFDAANPGACGGAQPACVNWGRVNVIRVAPALNRVYLGLLDTNNVGRIVALDATTNAVVGSWVGGSHSNRHTASFLIVNEAQHVLYVSDYTNNKVTRLDAATLSPIGSPTALPGGPSAMAFNVTSNRLYVSAIDGKTIYAIDGNTLGVVSSVTMPLSAYFMWVDEVESRVYASGGDNADESGAMVITDVLGQLGTNVTVTSAGSALHGATQLHTDGSITYTPNPGYSGADSFSYNIAAPTGTAIGTVSINVVSSAPAAIAFGDGYSTGAGQLLTVVAPGPLGNDSTGGSLTTMVVEETTDHGILTPQQDGSFTYQPGAGFTGVDSFVYHAVTDSLGVTNPVTVTISVTAAGSLVVTNTNDSGVGSLRQALSTANVEPGSMISFNIPGAGPHVISVVTALPSITAPVTVDGYTQPGSSPNSAVIGTNAVIKIALNGTGIPGTGLTDGFQLNGGGSTIRGIAIGGFRSSGIFMGTAGGNTIEGNFLGTDASGTTAVPNGLQTSPTNASGAGVISRSPNNLIGGASLAARNLISGNYSQGVRVDSQSSTPANGTGTTIINNLIGTNATGNFALANGLAATTNGIGITVTVPDVIIGGSTPSLRNVVSGNNGTGINAFASTIGSPQAVVSVPSNLTIKGNYVGVKADGTGSLGNTGTGIFIGGANSHIGGANATPGAACSGDCNVIAGNGGNGVIVGVSSDTTALVVTSSAAGSFVVGNYIGINPAGTAPMANTSTGISVSAANVHIGGTTPAERNVVSGNGQSGISVGTNTFNATTLSSTGTGTLITGNYVGVDATGTTAMPNNTGISVSVPAVRIGGITAGERNVISGNIGNGIVSFASRASNSPLVLTVPSGLIIQNNYVGLKGDGSGALGNTTGGITLSGPNSQVLNNVLSGNTNATGFAAGLNIVTNYEQTLAGSLGTIYSSPDGTVVYGNIIGLDPTGTTAIPNEWGLQLNAPNVTVGGSGAGQRNVVSGNNRTGIGLGWNYVTTTNAGVASAAGSVVRGNYVGLNSAGTAAVVNLQSAIFSGAPNVMIGGPAPGDGNLVVAASSQTGVGLGTTVQGPNTFNSGGDTVQSNTLGLAANGTTRLNLRGNITVGSAGNHVLDNIIAGNGTNAATVTSISIFPNQPGSADNNDIRRNIIGTNASGVTGLHNFGAGMVVSNANGTIIDSNTMVGGNDVGIALFGNPGTTTNNTSIIGNRFGLMPDGQAGQDPANRATMGIMITNNGGAISGTTIGGNTPAARNVFGTLSNNAIGMYNAGVTNTTIKGNYIGVAADGTTARDNTLAGIWISDASDNLIGGPGAGDGNLIANNNQVGIGMNGNSVRNRIQSNRIYSNGGLGIDLGVDGVTANDNGDTDAGANFRQNFPVITDLTVTPSASEVSGTLDSTPNTTFTLQLFRNTTCDSSGYGEGAELRDTQTMGTGPTGLGFWTLLAPGPGGGGWFYSVTATDPNGNTSEFSACYPASGSSIVTNTNLTGNGSLAAAITNANNTPGTQTITFNIPGTTALEPAVISLGGVAMPIITGPVVIDATSQPGWDGKPVIELAGNNNVSNGFETAADVFGVTIKGFAITGFTGFGIVLTQAENQSGDFVQQNYIGTDRFGSDGKGNGTGVRVRADASTINNNVISGNAASGILIDNDANNVTVTANQIGTMADGVTPRPNFGDGIALDHSAHNNVINANTISSNNGWGINSFHTASLTVAGTLIRSNYIGTSANGLDLGNLGGGIRLDSTPQTIVGGPGFRNVISGNGGTGPQIGVGIQVLGTAVIPPVIQNNFIGLSPDGIYALSNNNKGIVLDAPAKIGGTGANEGNWISGNGASDPAGAGIMISPGADNTEVAGNVIGLNISNANLGNTYAGITVRSSGFVMIGGTTPSAANVISSNGSYGISVIKVLGTDTPANVFIQRNFIGSDGSGNAPHGNGLGGVNVENGASIHIGGSGGNGNVIAFNGGPGVRVMDGASTARIQENSMRGNFIGIDLGGNGHTANDGPADSDSGANAYQNYAAMVSAVTTGSQNTSVTFDPNQLNPGNQFTVEFFAAASCDGSGFGQGYAFAGSTVVTGGAGNTAFTLGLSVALGQVITATTTDASGNTSEFSNCVTVTVPGPAITSVEPSAFASGQMITINGSNFAAQNLQDVVIRQASADIPVNYVWLYSPTKIIARTPTGLANGPATVVVKTSGGNPESTIGVTIQTQEGTPHFITMRNGNCNGFGGPGDTTQAWSGGDLYLVASGIDTSGAEAVFTPAGGGASVTVSAYLACGFPGGGDVAVNVQVPALTPGNYNVTVRSHSLGHQSLDSNAKPIQIVAIFLNAQSGGASNTNCSFCTGPGGAGSVPPFVAGTIKNGQTINFSANGSAFYPSGPVGPQGIGPTCGPDCLAPNLVAVGLIGRINNGPWFTIGAGATIVNSWGQGYLELALNDSGYTDNSGGWTVTVSPQ